MAMVISTFHRMIQNRVLWAAILVIIVLSFVVWGTPYLFDRDRDSSGSAGTLHGEPVSKQAFNEAYQHIYLGIAMSSGRKPNLPDRARPLIEQAAWRRLALLAEARRLGLQATDDEIEREIQGSPVFQHENQFNPNAFAAFVQRFLRDLGATEADYREHLRQEITLFKLRRMYDQAVLAPPQDLESMHALLNDTFKVEYVELTPKLVESAVQVTPEQVQAFFEKDPTRYKLPRKVKIQYVHFDHAPHLSDITFSDQDAEDYYEERIDDYTEMVPDTSSNAVAAATNGAPPMVRRIRPFEEVKDDVTQKYRRALAMDRAERQATEFVSLVAGDRDGKPVAFAEAAARMNLEGKTTEAFASDEKPAGVAAGDDFVEAAFSLRPTPDENFSAPVRGENGVYVLGLVERIAPREPTLDEVRERVEKDARADALARALREKADALREAAGRADGSLAQAAQAMGLTPVTTPEFTLRKGFEGDPNADYVMRAVPFCNSGEMTEVIETPGDSLIVARVVERKAASRAELLSLRSDFMQMRIRQRESEMREVREEHMARKAGVPEVKPATEPDESADDEADA